MAASAPAPWRLLLGALRRSPRPKIQHAAIVAAGCDPSTLLDAGLIARVDGIAWRPPDCEHECTVHVDHDTRAGDGLTGVACPIEPPCFEGWRWVQSELLDVYTCAPARVLEALREVNGLEPPVRQAEPPAVAVGRLRRRGLDLPVVWMHATAAPLATVAAGLAARAGADGLVLVVSRPAVPLPLLLPGTRVVAIDVPEDGIDGDLQLHRALDLLDPAYRQRRLTDQNALFDDVRIELAHVGDRHVVRINGSELAGFQQSDLKFLRLLLVAGARRADADADGGGWFKKWRLHGDEKDHDLEALRDELRKGDHPLSVEERGALIKSSRSRDSTIRLAVPPSNVVFDASLSDFRLVGEPEAAPRRGKRMTPGMKKHEQNVETGLEVAKNLLAEAQKLGFLESV